MTARPAVTPPQLLRVQDAAKILDVEAAGLRRVAEAHGYLIRVGRAVRVRADELGEIVEKCRDQPKAHASTSAATRTDRPDGLSSTPAAPKLQPALAASAKLKARSRPTSPTATASPVVALHRTK